MLEHCPPEERLVVVRNAGRGVVETSAASLKPDTNKLLLSSPPGNYSGAYYELGDALTDKLAGAQQKEEDVVLFARSNRAERVVHQTGPDSKRLKYFGGSAIIIAASQEPGPLLEGPFHS